MTNLDEDRYIYIDYICYIPEKFNHNALAYLNSLYDTPPDSPEFKKNRQNFFLIVNAMLKELGDLEKSYTARFNTKLPESFYSYCNILRNEISDKIDKHNLLYLAIVWEIIDVTVEKIKEKFEEELDIYQFDFPVFLFDIDRIIDYADNEIEKDIDKLFYLNRVKKNLEDQFEDMQKLFTYFCKSGVTQAESQKSVFHNILNRGQNALHRKLTINDVQVISKLESSDFIHEQFIRELLNLSDSFYTISKKKYNSLLEKIEYIDLNLKYETTIKRKDSAMQNAKPETDNIDKEATLKRRTLAFYYLFLLLDIKPDAEKKNITDLAKFAHFLFNIKFTKSENSDIYKYLRMAPNIQKLNKDKIKDLNMIKQFFDNTNLFPAGNVALHDDLEKLIK